MQILRRDAVLGLPLRKSRGDAAVSDPMAVVLAEAAASAPVVLIPPCLVSVKWPVLGGCQRVPAGVLGLKWSGKPATQSWDDVAEVFREEWELQLGLPGPPINADEKKLAREFEDWADALEPYALRERKGPVLHCELTVRGEVRSRGGRSYPVEGTVDQIRRCMAAVTPVRSSRLVEAGLNQMRTWPDFLAGADHERIEARFA